MSSKEREQDINPKIEITADGSDTLLHHIYGDSYHSLHGAEQESEHIFIGNGLLHCKKSELRILEVGFGTGLNAFKTMEVAMEEGLNIDYYAVELYPLSVEIVEQLSYATNDFLKLHQLPWGERHTVNPHFNLKKVKADLREVEYDGVYDLVYFDAFAPTTQPELWSKEVFTAIYGAMSDGAVLVTYSVMGKVRRTLKAIGFNVERIEGPPGKRHILRATKPNK